MYFIDVLESSVNTSCIDNEANNGCNNERHKSSHRGTARIHYRAPEKWKQSVRKKSRQRGQEYINSKGELVPQREVKLIKDCSKCRYKCILNIPAAERQKIHQDFWRLSDEQKQVFYSKTTISSSIARRRVETAATARNQSISYYFFHGELKYRVCKQFYTDTLNIGKMRIEYHHDQLKDAVTDIPSMLKWGRHTK